jgi:hypothetical protein
MPLNNIESSRLTQAYDRMLARVKDTLKHAEPKLHEAIDLAREKAIELEELTIEEAQDVANYLRRDMMAAGKYLASDEVEDLKSWFRFDVQLIETQLLDLLFSVADKTRLDRLNFEDELQRGNEYHTGEITGPGTLVCDACGEQINFNKTGHIPPCPKCHGTIYSRYSPD